jgi:hypothetical protein
MDDRSVGAQHLNEPAHVSSFEVVRQINGELDGGHGALHGMIFVANLQRIAEGFHSHAVNGQSSFVSFTLSVFQHGFSIFNQQRD